MTAYLTDFLRRTACNIVTRQTPPNISELNYSRFMNMESINLEYLSILYTAASDTPV
jgi:hypothetical protein